MADPKKSPKFVATPGTGFKDNSGTNNQPKTVTSGDRAKEALKKAVKTSVGISPFTAMDSVDPTTGQVLPTGMGQGPTNVGNANTAQTLQAQADAQAVKANRAGKPATTADVITQTPMTMQGNFKNSSISAAARMFGNVSNPVPSPSQNKGDLNKKENKKGYIKESTSGRGTSYDQKKEGKTLKGGRKYKYYKDGEKVAVAKNHVSGFGKNKRLTGSTIDIK